MQGADYFGTFMALGLIPIFFILLVTFFYWCFFYLIIKTAVKNGMIEAHRKTDGLGGSSGGGAFVHGYPPAQEVGPPPAPTYRG